MVHKILPLTAQIDVPERIFRLQLCCVYYFTGFRRTSVGGQRIGTARTPRRCGSAYDGAELSLPRMTFTVT